MVVRNCPYVLKLNTGQSVWSAAFSVSDLKSNRLAGEVALAEASRKGVSPRPDPLERHLCSPAANKFATAASLAIGPDPTDFRMLADLSGVIRRLSLPRFSFSVYNVPSGLAKGIAANARSISISGPHKLLYRER
jgi:hypothetical protein